MRAPVRQIATAHHARCRAALAIFFSPLLSAPDAGRGPRPTVEEGFAAYLREDFPAAGVTYRRDEGRSLRA